MIRHYEKAFLLDPLGETETTVTFYDAGHILGSAGVLIEKNNRQIFYTGDVNFQGHSLIKGARFPQLNEPDLLIMETTRGADERPTNYTRADQEKLLAKGIRNALEAGGSTLIPVFAIGKTQEVLTMIDNFKSEGLIPDQTPVFIGGLSTKMTVIYDSFSDSTRRHRPNFEILRDMKVQTGNKRRRAPIEYKPGAIYCLSSGMMSEKTTSNIFARSFLQNPANSLLFVGSAEPTTPAGAIKKASSGDVIRLDGTHKVQLNCAVEEFDFSGHARREELLEFAVQARPKKILLVHGDPDAVSWFKPKLAEALPETEVITPQPKVKIHF
jgi:Cft2 family RNA processing exonuclease